MNSLNFDLAEFLEAKFEQYNQKWFIETDPIQIPHAFSKKEDIEIAAFISSTLAWGMRPLIIKAGKEIINRMDNAPFDFIMNAQIDDFEIFNNFVYRTFNTSDITFFLKSLQNIYRNHRGLEALFTNSYLEHNSIKEAISSFRQIFFQIPFPNRSSKHISDVNKNSAAKRINMFLMWMVRNDHRGVHFGLWKSISPKHLILPLDTHTSRIGKELGLLSRKQNDWIAANEITENLRKFDANDPVKYDFSLFGFGVFEKKLK